MENDPANNGPPVAQVQIPEVPPPGLNLIPAPATVTAPMNSMKVVSHVTKFNGENFEFLVIMEQFGLASLIDATGGQVEVLPAEVKILFNYTCVNLSSYSLRGVLTHSNCS